MNAYDFAESARRFMPGLSIIARLDGRNFHTFTKDLKRPFDERFSGEMIQTTKDLISETQAIIVYTQSDEITLLFYANDTKGQVFFGGRIQKMNSILSSLA